MKRLYIVGALLLFMGLSLYLRIALPYDQVFTSEWIKFTSIDAYSHMTMVDRIAPNFPQYISQIRAIPFFNWSLSAVIWCVGFGSPTQHTIDTVAVYFPAILGALTIIPAYVIGRVMFGQLAGIVATGLVAILPGEWLWRSSLGFTDHHVAEVLFTTTIMMFLILAIKAKTGRRLIFYGLLATLFMYVYWLTWSASLLFVLIILTFLCVHLGSACLRHRNYLGVVGLILVSGTIVAIFYESASRLLPSGATALATIELMPLTIYKALWNFGLTTFLIPIVLIVLIYQVVKYGDAGTLLLLVWSLVILVLTVSYIRFVYYFAINVALLIGWFIWFMWRRLSKGNIPKAIAVTALLCGLVVFPNVQQAITDKAYLTPSDAWCETLEWVRESTPKDSLILAWWDYGYWISHIADREAYVNPGQWPGGITNLANMLLSLPQENLIEADYLILDYSTATEKLFGIAIWAGVPLEDYRFEGEYSQRYYRSLMARLYFGSEVSEVAPIGQYELVYESEQEIEGVPEVKVFRKRWN